MEHDAMNRLIKRLDECLREHVIALGKKGEDITLRDIYELQDMSALHFYLTTEHSFSPAEVAALLKFSNPLEVAYWCQEENGNYDYFPICELLKKINAYQRFEQTAQEKTSVKTRLNNAALRAEKSAPAKESPRSTDAR